MTSWWRIDPAEQDETDRAAEGSFASAAAADPMRAAVLEALTKGDTPGHDFHGNQYTGGRGATYVSRSGDHVTASTYSPESAKLAVQKADAWVKGLPPEEAAYRAPGSGAALQRAATDWQTDFDWSRDIQIGADGILGRSSVAAIDGEYVADARELLNAMAGNGPKGATPMGVVAGDVVPVIDGNEPIGTKTFGSDQLVRGVADPTGDIVKTFSDARQNGTPVAWSMASFVDATHDAALRQVQYGGEPLPPVLGRTQTPEENATGSALLYAKGDQPALLIRADGTGLSIDGGFEVVAGGTYAVKGVRDATPSEREAWAGVHRPMDSVTVVDLHQIENVKLPDGVGAKASPSEPLFIHWRDGSLRARGKANAGGE